MNRNPPKALCGLVATAAAAILLLSCRGSSGQNGLNGTNGTNGSNGSNGTPGATYAIDAATQTLADIKTEKKRSLLTGLFGSGSKPRKPTSAKEAPA